jgi:hypothetical protein
MTFRDKTPLTQQPHLFEGRKRYPHGMAEYHENSVTSCQIEKHSSNLSQASNCQEGVTLREHLWVRPWKARLVFQLCVWLSR